MLKINNNTISKEPVFLNSIFTKALGVMFRKNIKKPYIFTFSKEAIISLHMWFVFTSIDVLFLNKNKKIVEIKQDFKPFSFYRPKNKAKYIIELPKKTIKKHNLKLNQQTDF